MLPTTDPREEIVRDMTNFRSAQTVEKVKEVLRDLAKIYNLAEAEICFETADTRCHRIRLKGNELVHLHRDQGQYNLDDAPVREAKPKQRVVPLPVQLTAQNAMLLIAALKSAYPELTQL